MIFGGSLVRLLGTRIVLLTLSALLLKISTTIADSSLQSHSATTTDNQCSFVENKTTQFQDSTYYFSSSLKTPPLIKKTKASNARWQILANDILHDLLGDDVNSELGSYPEIRITKAKLPNAYAYDHNHLIVTSGLLERLESSEEFAFVLAHELGHLFLHHHSMAKPTSMTDYIEREKEADQYAIKLLRGTQFNKNAGPKLLVRLSEIAASPNDSLKSAYPSIMERLVALNTISETNKNSF